MGTFFVSGIKNTVKTPMTKTQAEKNKNIPNLRKHNMDKKA
jgi:hypothetical protein